MNQKKFAINTANVEGNRQMGYFSWKDGSSYNENYSMENLMVMEHTSGQMETST